VANAPKDSGLWLPGMPWSVPVRCRKNSGVLRLRGKLTITDSRTGKTMTPPQVRMNLCLSLDAQRGALAGAERGLSLSI
jgi:hypothetical protein